MKVVINKCYGGFGLSYSGVMEYAKLAGFKIRAYVDDKSKKYDPKKHYLVEYFGDGNPFIIYYSTRPLTKGGQLQDKGYFYERDIPRNSPILVKVVEQLGDKANGTHALLKVIDIPIETNWEVTEYDGIEKIEQTHASWG